MILKRKTRTVYVRCGVPIVHLAEAVVSRVGDALC